MDCIKSLKHLDALRESWVNLVLDLRRTTFAYAEQQANIHIEKILKTCLRISRVSLQYVVGGVQVCKEAFYWAHGFSESNFNKVHARVNEEYNASNPVKVTLNTHAGSGFIVQATCVAHRKKFPFSCDSSKRTSLHGPRQPRNGLLSFCCWCGITRRTPTLQRPRFQRSQWKHFSNSTQHGLMQQGKCPFHMMDFVDCSRLCSRLWN